MIVLDVNAAIAIAKGTEEGRVLRELMMEGEEVVAPHFFLTELGNVVWQIVRAGELDEEDFPVLFERAAGFVDRFVPAEASRTKEKCDALKAKIESTTKTKIETAKVDADNAAEVAELIRAYKPDAVLNVALPYQEEGCHKKTSLQRTAFCDSEKCFYAR